MAKVIDLERAELIYSIDEGKRYTIGKISTNLDDVFDKKVFTPSRMRFYIAWSSHWDKLQICRRNAATKLMYVPINFYHGIITGPKGKSGYHPIL